MNDVAGFIQAAAAASLLAKLVVDGIKMAIDLPRWGPVLLAFLAAECGEFLLLTSQGAQFDGKSISQAVIVGLIAWGLSIGVTQLQSSANKTEARVEAALQLPAGSSKADVDAAVKEGENK